MVPQVVAHPKRSQSKAADQKGRIRVKLCNLDEKPSAADRQPCDPSHLRPKELVSAKLETLILLHLQERDLVLLRVLPKLPDSSHASESPAASAVGDAIDLRSPPSPQPHRSHRRVRSA